MIKMPKTDPFIQRKIIEVMDRAQPILDRNEIEYPRLSFLLDLELTHEQCPLDFDALLTIDEGQFMHDILGIRKHMDREKGVLCDSFVPRCCLADIPDFKEAEDVT